MNKNIQGYIKTIKNQSVNELLDNITENIKNEVKLHNNTLSKSLYILADKITSEKEDIKEKINSLPFEENGNNDFMLKLKDVMNLRAGDVMNKRAIYIKKDEHLLKAASIMKLKDIARLPVVDDNKRLIGILTKRDIFRALVGKYS